MNDETQVVPEGGQEEGLGDKTIAAVDLKDLTIISQEGQPVTSPVSAVANVEMKCSQLSTYILVKSETLNYLLAEVSAWFDNPLAYRPPLNLALVVDRSGSMEGRSLEELKVACKHIVDSLSPNDVLSIVTFAENVDVVMPARRVINKDLIKKHIEAIKAKGITNLFGGMTAGVQEINSVSTPNHVKRVILLTDGEANAGVTDFDSIIAEVRLQRGKNVTYSTLGVGIEYNAELMMQIAKNGGGNYFYIKGPEEIVGIFKGELDSLFKIVAKEVKLKLHLTRDIGVNRAFGYLAHGRNRSVEIDLPDLENGETLPVLIELAVKPHPLGRFRKIVAELACSPVGAKEPNSIKEEIISEFTYDPALVAKSMNEAVNRALKSKDIVSNLEKAQEMMKRDLESATVIIEDARTILLEAGRTSDATLVADSLEQLKRGDVEDATKRLSRALFEVDLEKRKKED